MPISCQEERARFLLTGLTLPHPKQASRLPSAFVGFFLFVFRKIMIKYRSYCHHNITEILLKVPLNTIDLNSEVIVIRKSLDLNSEVIVIRKSLDLNSEVIVIRKSLDC